MHDSFYKPNSLREFIACLRADDAKAGGVPLEDWTRGLFNDAKAARASDIHIDPLTDAVRIRFRIDGSMQEMALLSPARGLRLIRFLKVSAGLDPAPSLVPEDAHLRFDLVGGDIEFRLACAPCLLGDKLTLRIHERRPVTRGLSDLGLADSDLDRIQGWLGDISGMFVFAGPAGGGKTTTLYALLSALDLKERNIITIEDPVEYCLEGINQIEVDPKRDLTLGNCLRSALRHDPDHLLLGEIRDRETARVAIEAASTGRALLTTMHGRNAAGVVTALRNLAVPAHQLAASLAFIVAQRLVRRLCPLCRKLEAPTEVERRWLDGLRRPIPSEVWHRQGCPNCDGTGYFQRIGIFEVGPVEERIYDLILAGKDEHHLREDFRLSGQKLLLQDGLEKANAGTTDLGELARIGAQSYLDSPQK